MRMPGHVLILSAVKTLEGGWSERSSGKTAKGGIGQNGAMVETCLCNSNMLGP